MTYRPTRLAAAVVGLALLLTPAAVRGGTDAEADVVLVVDTSGSMSRPGMDPERTSLLVSRLFTDIVPGRLAVVRLHDVVLDSDVLRSRETGEVVPCADDEQETCFQVEAVGDWNELAREHQVGALKSSRRGDADFKERLDAHLQPNQNHSQFLLAFQSARGVLDEYGEEPGRTRTVIWLSDGKPNDAPRIRKLLTNLQDSGVRVEAILFGQGDPALARQAGVEVRQAATPRALMAAFTDVFRGVVDAPFGIDAQVAEAPSFEIEPNVDEAWVVVYGDASLRSAILDGPDGPIAADHGGDRHSPAGAYRVAYLRDPTPGTWTLRTDGGGSGAVYSVIQRSSLTPALLEPETATSGARTLVVAGIRSGDGDGRVTSPQVLDEAKLVLEVGGERLPLRDDGREGDRTASDGLFSGFLRFSGSGEAPVRLRLTTSLVDRVVETTVDVTGSFVYRGGPVAVDLGALRAGESSCQPLRFEAEHEGTVEMELRLDGELPPGHRVELRGETLDGLLTPGGDASGLAAGGKLELCLLTERGAPSSRSTGEPILALAVVGSQAIEHRVPIVPTWQVSALSFWERWWKVILTLLLLLVILAVVAGYLLPHRFSGALALTFVPERRDLDDQLPQPVRQWKGVGVGFYRHARAFLHADYRVSGSHRGALAGLQAERRNARVVPGKGATLSRETVDGDWERVPASGRPIRPGDVYRVGDSGPYFRVGSRR
jgi:hypothetical protein